VCLENLLFKIFALFPGSTDLAHNILVDIGASTIFHSIWSLILVTDAEFLSTLEFLEL
jgi:hypothetical protein